MFTFLMDDVGIPLNYRHMEGFGVHTYTLMTRDGKVSFLFFFLSKSFFFPRRARALPLARSRPLPFSLPLPSPSHHHHQTTYVKFHWKPSCGVKCLLDAEAERVGGANHSHATQDLFESIASGDYPEWQLLIQTMDPAAEDSFDFDPLDVTKIWPEDRFPLQPVGRMVLNKNPDNFFNENEMLVRGESVFLLDRFFFFRSSRSRFVVPPLFRFPSLSLSLPSLFVFVSPPLTPATSTPDGKTKNPKNRPSARRWSCPGSATRTTSCCRRASSPTPTRSVTGWAPTTCSSPPTRRGLPTTTTTTTGP